MKFQIYIPDDISILLRELAIREHRPIRHQAEFLLHEAIKLAVSYPALPDGRLEERVSSALVGAAHE